MMFNLLKDILNPINWLKLIINPKKIKIIYERIVYYPGLRFGYSKSNLYKKIVIKFTILLAKRNKKFKEIFFSESQPVSFEKIKYNFANNIFDKQKFESLKDNGILILENVLNQKEHKDIQTDFELHFKSNLAKELNNMKSDSIIMKKIDKKINQNSSLIKISNLITKEIYGCLVKPNYHYFYTQALNLPEKKFPGDNIFHVDRFLPNLKIIYFPYSVDKDSSPFKYALGSHKINQKYLDFFLDNKKWVFDERNPNSQKFLINAKEIPVNENSIIVALTNGFHSRAPFRKKSERSALFFTYPQFNLVSLFFPNN